ncbi:MAG: SDR family NAD(P)-dependent oxidoreductase, partial [Bdellovibrionota bacterium]
VTGASSGIGYELAKQFAENGHDILIVAEDQRIYSVASEIQSQYNVQVEALQLDLIRPESSKQLYSRVQETGRQLDFLALNAGVGVGGPFLETDFEREVAMIHLNVVANVLLTKLFLKDMVDRDSGAILFTSSVVSIMPAPFQAVYGGTKAFLRSFISAIRSEIKDSNVTLTALMPNATETEFFERADLLDTEVGQAEKDDPAVVAKQGYEGLMSGDKNVMGGSLKSRMQGQMARILPKDVTADMGRKMAEPGSAHKHDHEPGHAHH